MTKAEEMTMQTVHDLGTAGAWNVQNYTGLSVDDATAAFDSLAKAGYLEVADAEDVYDVNEYGDFIITGFVFSWRLTPTGEEAAKGLPLCIPITNIQLEKMEERK